MSQVSPPPKKIKNCQVENLPPFMSFSIILMLEIIFNAGFRTYPFTSQYGGYPMLPPELTSW